MARLLVTPSEALQERLDTALDDLRQAFAACYLAPGFADRCSPLGDRRAIASRLAAGPPYDPADLAIYEVKAISTMGSAADFAHFLPALAAAQVGVLRGDRALGIGEHTDVFNTLGRVDWAIFGESQQATLVELLDSFLANALATYISPYPPLDLTINLGQYLPVERMTAAWARDRGPGAVLNLAHAMDPTCHVSAGPVPVAFREWLAADEQIERVLGAALGANPRLAAELHALVSHL